MTEPFDLDDRLLVRCNDRGASPNSSRGRGMSHCDASKSVADLPEAGRVIPSEAPRNPTASLPSLLRRQFRGDRRCRCRRKRGALSSSVALPILYAAVGSTRGRGYGASRSARADAPGRRRITYRYLLHASLKWRRPATDQQSQPSAGRPVVRLVCEGAHRDSRSRRTEYLAPRYW